MIIQTQLFSKTTGRIFKGVNIQTCVWVWFRNHITKATFNIRNHPFIVDKRLYNQVTPINWCNLKWGLHLNKCWFWILTQTFLMERTADDRNHSNQTYSLLYSYNPFLTFQSSKIWYLTWKEKVVAHKYVKKIMTQFLRIMIEPRDIEKLETCVNIQLL